MIRLQTVAVGLALLAGLVGCRTNVSHAPMGSDQPVGDERVQAERTAEAHALAAESVTLTVVAANADATAAAEAPGPAAKAGSPEDSAMPVISAFDCDPCLVTPGGGARLSWQASNAQSVLLDGRGVTAPGEEVVYPDQTTTYRLSATNAAGRSEKTVTVVVAGLPMIHFFTCLPCQIHAGDQATLSWDLSGGTAVYLDGEGVPAPGSLMVAPSKTTTYRLEAVSDQGSVTRLVTVAVLEGGTDESVEEALTAWGYQVRAVTELAFEAGKTSRAVVMLAQDTETFNSRTSADQVYRGFEALHDNFSPPLLSVGLYDGGRRLRLVTVRRETLESYQRGDIDGVSFWRAARYDTWDEWSGRWEAPAGARFLEIDFAAKDFQR